MRLEKSQQIALFFMKAGGVFSAFGAGLACGAYVTYGFNPQHLAQAGQFALFTLGFLTVYFALRWVIKKEKELDERARKNRKT